MFSQYGNNRITSVLPTFHPGLKGASFCLDERTGLKSTVETRSLARKGGHPATALDTNAWSPARRELGVLGLIQGRNLRRMLRMSGIRPACWMSTRLSFKHD